MSKTTENKGGNPYILEVIVGFGGLEMWDLLSELTQKGYSLRLDKNFSPIKCVHKRDTKSCSVQTSCEFLNLYNNPIFQSTHGSFLIMGL